MGMSASQARFLILTAQKNNNEYQAQRITHERLVLAQNVENWTMEYNDKMNNKTLLFNPNTAADTDLYNYNKRLTYDDIVRSQYLDENPGIGARLLTSSGKVIVPEKPTDVEIARYNGKTVVSQATYDSKKEELIQSLSADLKVAEESYLASLNAIGDNNKETSEALTQQYQEYLNSMAEAIDKAMEAYWVNTKDENQETLPGYVDSVFEGLEEDDFFVDPSITDPVALQMALQNGIYTISMYTGNPTNPDEAASWKDVHYLNDTATKVMEVLDKTDDAEAQAKYDRLNSSFHQKDKMLELRLKQLESEHKALETEMESVKKVIQEDVESSFKTFG